MTLFLDTSAWIRRYAHDRDRNLVVASMTDDLDWCASALARTETQLVLQRLATSPEGVIELWRRLRDDWEAVHVVPVDDRCLARATEIGAEFGVRTLDAIHLAAADRLPAPVDFLSFDRHQLPAAVGLGLRVITPTDR